MSIKVISNRGNPYTNEVLAQLQSIKNFPTKDPAKEEESKKKTYQSKASLAKYGEIKTTARVDLNLSFIF